MWVLDLTNHRLEQESFIEHPLNILISIVYDVHNKNSSVH